VPVSHYGNVLAHGTNALLGGLIWRRWLGDGRAFAAALVWAALPSHVGAIAWAVGRVDSYTTVWCLSAVWLGLRRQEAHAAGQAAPGWPLLLATAAAFASKELAIVVPPLLTLLLWLRGAGTGWQRTRAVLRLASPAWLVAVAYVPFRWCVLGRLGGYAAAAWDPLAIGRGLGQVLADILVPLRWCGPLPGGPAAASPLWFAAAMTPPALAVGWLLWRQPARAVLALLAAAIATAPMANFLAEAHNPHNLRYYYLPTLALVGAVASGGWLPALALLSALAGPLFAVRVAQWRADTESAAMHRAIAAEADAGAASPMFVAGLPHANATATAVQLHFGIDRLLAPPFGDDRVVVRALRPLAEVPGVFRLEAQDGVPQALPLGSTWFFAGPTAFGQAPPPPPLPALDVTGDAGGRFDLTTPTLFAMARGERHPGLQTPNVRPQAFRLTLFTANGYLVTLFEDHGDGNGSTGRFDARTWFSALGTFRIGRTTLGSYIGDALAVPTSIDRVPEFPVLLEAGSYTVTGHEVVFQPTHRSRRLLTFVFDRDYPKWVRAMQGT
jgi:hypothetical protein